MGLRDIVHSSGWRQFMSKMYGIGASIVIIGALFKIQHWPMAGLLLTIGLTTEAVIFFFSAFEPLHEEYDWTLVYPELAGVEADDPVDALQPRSKAHTGAVPVGVAGGGAGLASLTKFDQMLEGADITPDLFEKLGTGMKKFSEASEAFTKMGDASTASQEYINSVKSASQSLGTLNETYRETEKVISESNDSYKNIADSLSGIEAGGKSYQEHIEGLNKNLTALNAVYEMQLRSSDQHVKDTGELYKELQGMMKDLTDSAGDTKQYREQITALNENLAALNNVYGNMLSAMNTK